jgi:ribosome maturation factor RimP
MIQKEQVREIVESFLKDSDYFIVDVKVDNNNKLLVEIDSTEGISIDTCAALSRHIESNLDREAEDYELEVGSPGLGLPFKVIDQYFKYEGNEVDVLDINNIKYQGILNNVNEDGFCLEITKKVKPDGAKRKIEVTENIPFEYKNIKYTKYTIRFK